MSPLPRETRDAVRSLRHRPGSSFLVLAVLALGIGANSAVFRVADAVLFRPLPVQRPVELARLFSTDLRGSPDGYGCSYPHYLEYRDQIDAFSGLAASADGVAVNVATGTDQPERLAGAIVTGNYFEVLGLRAALGRLLGSADENAPGGLPMTVLADRLWRRSFGADPHVVGRTIRLNGRPFTVVGVAPAGFAGLRLDRPSELWVTVAMAGEIEPIYRTQLSYASNPFLDVIGRLQPGRTLAQVRSQLDTIGARQGAGEPERDPKRIEAGMDWKRPWPGAAAVRAAGSGARRLSWLLLGVACLVLLLACADAAGVLLARGERRRREIAVRLALGAPPRRIARVLLIEGLVLSFAAGIVGLALSQSFQHLLIATAPPELPLPAGGTSLGDGRLLLFIMAVCLLTGTLFSLFPALRASRTDLVAGLKGDTHRHSKVLPGRNVLVLIQIAICTVLLVGAVLLLRTLWHAATVPLGFDPENVLIASLDLARQGYDKAEGAAFVDRALDAVIAAPGVRRAAFATVVPPAPGGTSVWIEGRSEAVGFLQVTPGYFGALAIPMLRGRDFERGDVRGSSRVGVVNQTLAARFWPGQDPIGRRIEDVSPEMASVEVVGVVGDVRATFDQPPRPTLHVPLAQFYEAFPWQPLPTLVVRTQGEARSFVLAMAAALGRLDPDLPLFRIRTLSEQVATALAQQRFLASLLSAFATLAVGLAAAGLYGLVSYTTLTRMREFGVRAALGARASDLLRLVLADSARLALAGLALGLGAAFGLRGVLAGLIFGVGTADPLSMGAVALLLLLVALVAAMGPARRAARIDPMRVLRTE